MFNTARKRKKNYNFLSALKKLIKLHIDADVLPLFVDEKNL